MGFYGQGYSISRFLIEMGGRPRFLEFVRDGMKDGWDTATRTHYQLANVRELDRAWRSWHRVAVPGRTGRPRPRTSWPSIRDWGRRGWILLQSPLARLGRR